MAAPPDRTSASDEIQNLAREDGLDDHDYQVREVYALFGLAVHLAPVLEKGVVNAVTLAEATGGHDVRVVVPFSDLQYDLQVVNAKPPLGPLLGKFRRHISENTALLRLLTPPAG